jgi:hypothetical protein
LAAQLGVEGHFFERLDAALEALAPVEVPEVPRIRQPRAQHALVAGDDCRPAVRGRNVGGEDEGGRGISLGIRQGEVALVHPHGDLPDFGRQIHELRVDPP